MRKVFLRAEWRHLAMLNYEVAPALLAGLVPRGTELDRWSGRVFVSLVGFRFLNTRVWGMPIPFHTNFDEVNLRFYVRREDKGETRRGVVFIRETVPRWAIAWAARVFYNENYVALPMADEIHKDDSGRLRVAYRWRCENVWAEMKLGTRGMAQTPRDGSEEQFITEHYWGYATQRDGSTVEYEVKHPAWRVWKAEQATFSGDVQSLYGPGLARLLSQLPSSAFLAEGSEVTVMRGRRLDEGR